MGCNEPIPLKGHIMLKTIVAALVAFFVGSLTNHHYAQKRVVQLQARNARKLDRETYAAYATAYGKGFGEGVETEKFAQSCREKNAAHQH
jgi:hypothetical protein